MEGFLDNMKALQQFVSSGKNEQLLQGLEFAEEFISDAIRFVASQVKKRRRERKLQSQSNQQHKRKADSSDDEDDSVSDEESLPDDIPEEDQKKQVSHFITKALPKVVVTLVDKRYQDEETKLAVIRFLRSVCKLVIQLFNFHIVEDLLRAFARIFDEEEKIYIDQKLETRTFNGKFVVSPLSGIERGNRRAKMNYHLVETVELFAQDGGFDTMVKVAKAQEIDVTTLNLLLRPVVQVRNMFRQEYARSFLPLLCDASVKLILSLNDQQLKETARKQTLATMEYLDYLYSVYMSDQTQIGKIIETLALDLALKCMASESLEKRLNALAEINDLIEMVHLAETPKKQQNQDNNNNQYYPARFVTSQSLLAWIIDHGIIEEVFGVRIHPAMVARTAEIFSLLAKKQKLTPTHLDTLWESSVGKQETLVGAIYKVIKKMSEYLNSKQLDYLFEKIAKVPVSEADKKLLRLVRKLLVCTTFSKQYIKSGTFRGLNTLWEIATSPAVPHVLRKESLSYLIEVLMDPSLAEKRDQFIDLCIQNLQTRTAVPQSLKVIKKLLEAVGFQQTSNDQIDYAVVSKELEKLRGQYNILTLVLQDVVQYCDETAKNFQQLNSGDVVRQLNKRLKFMDFVMRNSSLSLSVPNVDALWNSLIASSKWQEQVDLSFAWFQSWCGYSEVFHNVVDTTAYILLEKLCKLPTDLMLESSFGCIEHYFCYVNCCNNKLYRSETPRDLHDFIVQDLSLTGIDSIWRFALESKHEVVSQRAVDYIIGLYEKLSPELKLKRDQLHQEFLTTVLQNIKTAVQSNNESSDVTVCRCLQLIRRFNENFQKKFLKTRDTSGTPLSLVFNAPTRKNPTVKLDFFSSDTLGYVRSQLAKASNNEGKDIKLIALGKQFNQYELTLADLKIADNTAFLYMARDPTPESVPFQYDEATPQELQQLVQISPSIILATHLPFFTELWNLLDLKNRPVVVTQVWELLSNIPTNPQLLQNILAIRERVEFLSWPELFPEASPYKLLYALRIVLSIIDPKVQDQQPALDEQSLFQWKQNFSEKGGLQHLYSTYLESKQIQGNLLCEAQLLQIANYFMTGHEENGKNRYKIILNEHSSFVSQRKQPEFAALMKRLIDTIHNAVTTAAATQIINQDGRLSVEAAAVKHAVTLLVAILISKGGDLLKGFYSLPVIREICETAFLKCPIQSVRQELVTGIIQLCSGSREVSNAEPASGFFIEILLSFLKILSHSCPHCSEYFQLVNLLLVQARNDRPPQFWESLFDQVIQMIRNHPINEVTEFSEEDQVIIGLINLMCNIITIHPHFKQTVCDKKILTEIFWSCLFNLPNLENHGKLCPPKCKTKTSRNSTFVLLATMTKGHWDNFNTLMNLIKMHHTGIECSKWNYAPALVQRRSYVGLKNMGCTCYMNSLLQQLYMLPRFRKGVLSVDLNEELETAADNINNRLNNSNDSLSRSTDELPDPHEEARKESFMFQFQSVFSFLQESLRQAYNPRGFCYVNKDYEGNPMDVLVQMDVDEYFNMLCEKLDNMLKGRPQAKLLQNTWAAKFATQLICKGCPHRYEREELYYTVSLDIKDKRSITEAFELYVKGETLELDNAYFCEQCNAKRDTLKRTCIKTLPNTLIVHLKRFEFDYDSMKKVKLNDYCQFPMTLDLEPYTTVGVAAKELNSTSDPEAKQACQETLDKFKWRDSSYYQYELKGVIVHKGDSDSGHYYSFIKERNRVDGGEPQWFEFNDKFVSEFEVANLEMECFGGTETVNKWDPATRTNKTETVEKNRSAYMLIYERVVFQPADPTSMIPPKEETPQSPMLISAASTPTASKSAQFKWGWASTAIHFIAKVRRKISQRKLRELSFTVPAPDRLLDDCWMDNQKFYTEKLIFDDRYFNFVFEFIQQFQLSPQADWNATEANEETMRVLKFSIIFFFDILCHARERGVVHEYVNFLKATTEFCLPALKWLHSMLIKNGGDLIKQTFLECPVEEIRSYICDLLYHILTVSLRFEAGGLLEAQQLKMAMMQQMDHDESSMDIEMGSPLLSCQLIDTLLSWLVYDDWEYRYFDHYFRFFYQVLDLSANEIIYLLNEGTVSRFLRFFLDDDANNAKKLNKYTRAKKRGNINNWTNFLLFMAEIVCRSWTLVEYSAAEDDKPPTQIITAPNTIFELQNEDKDTFQQKNFLVKALKGANPKELVRLLSHYMWRNPTYAETVIDAIMTALSETDFDSLGPIFEVFFEILQIEDASIKHVVNYAMTKFVELMEEKKKAPKKTREFIRFLEKLDKENELCEKWVARNQDKLNWVDNWTKAHQDVMSQRPT